MKAPLATFSHRTIYDTVQDSPASLPRLQQHAAAGKTGSFLDDVRKDKVIDQSSLTDRQRHDFQAPDYKKNDTDKDEEHQDKFNVSQAFYDLQLMSADHLSYNGLSFYQAGQMFGGHIRVAEESENTMQHDDKVSATYFQSLQPVKDNSVNLLALFNKYDVQLDDQQQAIKASNTPIKQNETPVLKKIVSITGTELFIRNFFDDNSKMIEEIKGQLPEGIARIWLNGKIIWVKDI